MSSALFRTEVIEARRERLTGVVIAATPPRARTYGLLLLGMAAVMTLVLIFGSFASRAQVTGVVAYDRGIARVYTPSVGEVSAVHVRDGQLVAAGTPLVTVALTQGRNAEGEGVASQLLQIDRQDAELARQQRLAGDLGSSEIDALHQQQVNLQAAIGSLERQHALAEMQIPLAESESARAGRLAKAGAGTKRQVEEARAAAIARHADAEALEERLIAQREALRLAASQIAQKSLGAQQSKAEIAAQRASLAAQRAATERLGRLDLTAPIAGRVSDLIAEPGQRAQPQTSLVTIAPEGSRLEVWLYAPSRAAGFVHPGQEVRLLFDAFPFAKYGAGHGVVTAVSHVPTDPGAIDPGLKITDAVYRVKVRIDRAPTRAGAADQPIRPGMTLSANLVLERRALWEVFLDPILRALRQ